MNWINEYTQPGTYKHHKGGLYVLVNVLTDEFDFTTDKITTLPEPVVIFRDLIPLVEYVNSKPIVPHKIYSCPLSVFTGLVDEKVKRFTQI